MSDLTPQAMQFLQKHFKYDTRNFATKRSLRGKMEKFWRRREKAQQELAVLPPDHPRKAQISGDIDNATKSAENGDLTGAYKTLDAIKLAARVEANMVRNGLDINVVMADLVPLETKVRAVQDISGEAQDKVFTAASRYELYSTMVAPATEATTHEEAIKRAGDAMAAQREFRGKLDALAGEAKQFQDTHKNAFEAAPQVKPTLDRLEHNMGLLRAEGKVPANIEARYMTVAQKTVELGLQGRVTTFNNLLNERIRACRTKVDETCAAAIKLPPMDLLFSTDQEGNGLTVEEEAERLGDRFAELEKRGEERVERARERMRAEKNWDMYLERNPEAATPITPSRVDTFDTSDAMDMTALGFDPLDRSVDNDTFATAVATRVETLLRGAIDAYRNADPAAGTKVPDEVMEVASRTLESWCEDVAKSLGLVWDPDNLSPAFMDKIKAGAEAMQKKALEIYPDKASPDMSSFTMGGVVYDDVKSLGKGGGGEVFLAKSADGRKVVIKRPLSMDNLGKGDSLDPCIAEMRDELLTQRAVTGGEDGVCPDNLLEHKGMVLSAEGIPLPVMDLADAGDANEFNTSMSALSGAGVISESARQALVAAQMRDVLKGVKAMHDQGFAHFDLKELNVFMMSDGTYKVADFGLAQEATSRDEELTDMFETTEIYKAPEVEGDTALTMKGDMFSIGEMIKRGLATDQNYGLAQEGFGVYRPGSSARKENDGSDVEVSASTRLIAGLMAENPEDRPTLETALESSYFRELDEGHSPEQVERLRKAAAEYAATVGRETKDLEQQEMICRATITENRRILSKETIHDLIRAANLFIERTPREIKRLELAISVEKDAKKRDTLVKDKTRKEGNLAKVVERLAGYKKKVTEDVPERDATKARQVIEAQEEKLKSLRAQITAIREKSEYAAILTELEEANKAFR